MGFAESAELLGLFAIDPARFIHESVRSEPVEEPCFDRLSTNGAHVLFRFKSCRSNKQGIGTLQMPRRITTLVKHPQHQHINPRDAVIHGMAGAIAAPDVFLCQSASKFDHPTASNFDQGFMLISCAV